MPSQLRVERPRGDTPASASARVLCPHKCQPSGGSRCAFYQWLHNPVSTRAREDQRLRRFIRASYRASHGGMARLGSSSTSVRPARNAARSALRVSCESTRSERYTAIERLGIELLLESRALEPCSKCPRKTQRLNTFGRAARCIQRFAQRMPEPCSGPAHSSVMSGPLLHSPLLLGMALHLAKAGR